MKTLYPRDVLIAISSAMLLATWLVRPMPVHSDGVQPTTAAFAVTATIGGGMIIPGACVTTTIPAPGAELNMVVIASPISYPGDEITWKSFIGAPNSVTVKVCSRVTVKALATPYNIRVIR